MKNDKGQFKYQIYAEERAKGLTYRDIAERHGVSHQAVAQALARTMPNMCKYVKPDQCVYVNVRNWMNENHVSFAELCRRTGIVPYRNSITRMHHYLSGQSNPPKHVIDRLLSVTGMTYEKFFEVWNETETDY